jgi:hypothetical protein
VNKLITFVTVTLTSIHGWSDSLSIAVVPVVPNVVEPVFYEENKSLLEFSRNCIFISEYWDHQDWK